MNFGKFLRTSFFIEHLWWLLLKSLNLHFCYSLCYSLIMPQFQIFEAMLVIFNKNSKKRLKSKSLNSKFCRLTPCIFGPLDNHFQPHTFLYYVMLFLPLMKTRREKKSAKKLSVFRTCRLFQTNYLLNIGFCCSLLFLLAF